MKKLLFVCFVIMGLFSCKKDQTSCYACKMTIVTTVPSYPSAGSTTSATITQCDLTPDDAKSVEKAGTSTTTVTTSGITVTAKSTTICTKQ